MFVKAVTSLKKRQKKKIVRVPAASKLSLQGSPSVLVTLLEQGFYMISVLFLQQREPESAKRENLNVALK